MAEPSRPGSAGGDGGGLSGGWPTLAGVAPTAVLPSHRPSSPSDPSPADPAPSEEPGPGSWQRLLPRSVLGLTALVLAFAVGAAFSGAILYSYYEFKKDRTEKLVTSYVEGFDKRFKDALATIGAEAHNARAEIQRELAPLRQARAEGQTLETVRKKVEPAMYFVSTLDEGGQPSLGSAFAVSSDAHQTLLLASYATVKAATRQPGPALRVRKGNEDMGATLWTWHEDKDLALLVLSRGKLPTLPLAGAQVRPGERVFAASGLGAAGAALTQGFVVDVSASGLQHDAAVGPAFQGGPLVNSDGALVGVASRSYAPLGFTSDRVPYAPFPSAACEKVLRCSGAGPVPGERGSQPGR